MVIRMMEIFKTSIFICIYMLSCNARITAKANTPEWASSYTIEGLIQLPYAEIKENFMSYYDGNNNRSRIDYYGKTVITIQDGGQSNGISYKIAPMTTETQYNVRTCFKVKGSLEIPVSVQAMLPDLKEFKLIDKSFTSGKQCNVWYLEETIGQKKNTYSMYVDASNNHPIRYEMKGMNTLLGSHYDHYYIDYNNYIVTPLPDDDFLPPKDVTKCGNYPGPGMKGESRILMNPASQFFSNEQKDQDIDSTFSDFKEKHSKDYANHIIHEQRKMTFTHNLRYIHSKNRANLTYVLAVNHLADLDQRELKTMRGKLRPSTEFNGGRPFSLDLKQSVPDHLNWWLHGAVNQVKDQGICGSCWSFGATGAVEGAYFMKTGKLVRLSQQELMDCSWGEGNNACDGGEDFRAYQWIQKHGQTTEEQYGAYTQQDGYCHYKKVKPVALIDHWVNVTVGSETALRLALFQHGPISVAIDASHKSLSFYSNGVYYEPKCKSGVDELDHAVLAVGYGQWKGENYWLVRNSWSTYWGNNGYVLMSSKDNNCGVMTAPTYVVLK